MKTTFKSRIGMYCSAVLLFAACSEDFDLESHLPGEKEKQEYTKNWVKQFGEIDPNHTWNMCTSYNVTVNTSKESDIQIYALVDGKYKIVADYEKVSGEQTLQFDAIAGVTDICVSNGSHAISAKIGETVSFGGSTRAGIYSPEGTTEGIIVSRTEESDWKIFYEEDFTGWETKVPQQKDNTKKGLTMDFTYKAETDEIIIYPLLWGTSQVDIFGIYTIENGQKKQEIDFYAPKSGNELQYVSRIKVEFKGSSSDAINSQYDNTVKNSAAYKAMIADPDYIEGSFTKATYNWRGNMTASAYYMKKPAGTTDTWTWTDCPNQKYLFDVGSELGVQPRIYALRSRGIKINIGEGTEFGMYVDNKEGNSSDKGKWYSEKKYNGTKGSLAATYYINGKQHFSFEDRPGDTHDLNDVIFIIEGVTPLDKEADQWTIACEDLGETDDYDFNDLVFQVSHISGKTVAYLTPLAAGGVLEAYYGFDSSKATSSSNEIHGKFTKGGSTAGKDDKNDYYMINTNADAVHDGYNSETEEITVAKTFSLATDMGGFWIKVTDKDGSTKTITAPVHSLHSAVSTSNAPQMILVPFGWKWPKERIAISEAYSTFYDWNANQTSAENLQDWNKGINNNKVYKYEY